MVKRTLVIILMGILLIAGVSGINAGCNQNNQVTNGESIMTKTTPKIPPIDQIIPAKTETATFALGWFWGPDSQFGSLEGVIRISVGFAGGTTNNPTYYNLGNHSETVQIDFDPAIITYEELLDIFWNSHYPVGPQGPRQYMSIVFYHNEEQKIVALASKQRQETRLGQKIVTEVVSFSDFYLAEDYHQKYYLQQNPRLFNEFTTIYPDIGQLIRSTAVARVNGYLGGYGSFESLQKEINSFGLSTTGIEELLKIGGQLPSTPD